MLQTRALMRKPLNESKTIIRKRKVNDMDKVNSVSKDELDKIVKELDNMADDDLEYMADEEIDDEEIDEPVENDVDEDKLDKEEDALDEEKVDIKVTVNEIDEYL